MQEDHASDSRPSSKNEPRPKNVRPLEALKFHNLRMVCWNVNGLTSKLGEPGFVDYIKSFDICCLIETFTTVNFDFNTYFDEYKILHSPARKLSHHGRRSGGVIVMLKACIESLVSEIQVNYDNIIAFKISNFTFGNVIVVCVCMYHL